VHIKKMIVANVFIGKRQALKFRVKYAANIHYTGMFRPLGRQEVEVPRVSRHSAYEGGKVVSRSSKVR
jgi:hypothetical protein